MYKTDMNTCARVQQSEGACLTPDQNAALSLIDAGHNLYITGEGGTGKSFLIKHVIRRANSSQVAVTSTTGISAVQIGGMTIHHFSGARIFNESVDIIVSRIMRNKKQRKRWLSTSILIIDEISMLPPTAFDMLEEIARKVRCSDEPFGGIQMVLTGDFYQLPPVCRAGELPRYVFQSSAWKYITKTAVLTTNMRQTDNEFRHMLNQVRTGSVDDKVRAFFDSRRNISPPSDETYIQIYTHNIDVDAINHKRLLEINAPINEYVCSMTITEEGKKSTITEQYMRANTPCPLHLSLCVGCKVMHLVNSPELGLVNGSLGVVVDIMSNGDPVVKFKNGSQVIPKYTWNIESVENKKIITLATYAQYPLKLAYCSTVHKIQGQTFDAVELDLSRAFGHGMIYVALSRVRTIGGLYIKGLDWRRLKVDGIVSGFHRV